ncbi:MAG TPA: M14 family zinc carboxypeptidase, partial [Nocardioidaceae bacterium]|nr:M14 family zinc carboxypeptidase [Nocardioidaceae bacterium]
MRRKLLPSVLLSCVIALVASMLAATSTSAASSARQRDRLEVYVGEIAVGQLQQLLALGVDREALRVSAVRGARGAKATVRVEAILSKAQVSRLGAQGVDLKAKMIDGQTVTARATAQAAEGYTVFKKYAGPGGLREEFAKVAKNHPHITKLVNIGASVNGEQIVALKVTKGANRSIDGAKPAVLYLGAQHAREWITPEMIRRLMHRVVDGYRTKPSLHRLLNRNELWFVPVANPDGYDFTFGEGQRLWRKNLRDNNKDGEITPGDGV